MDRCLRACRRCPPRLPLRPAPAPAPAPAALENWARQHPPCPWSPGAAGRSRSRPAGCRPGAWGASRLQQPGGVWRRRRRWGWCQGQRCEQRASASAGARGPSLRGSRLQTNVREVRWRGGRQLRASAAPRWLHAAASNPPAPAIPRAPGYLRQGRGKQRIRECKASRPAGPPRPASRRLWLGLQQQASSPGRRIGASAPAPRHSPGGASRSADIDAAAGRPRGAAHAGEAGAGGERGLHDGCRCWAGGCRPGATRELWGPRMADFGSTGSTGEECEGGAPRAPCEVPRSCQLRLEHQAPACKPSPAPPTPMQPLAFTCRAVACAPGQVRACTCAGSNCQALPLRPCGDTHAPSLPAGPGRPPASPGASLHGRQHSGSSAGRGRGAAAGSGAAAAAAARLVAPPAAGVHRRCGGGRRGWQQQRCACGD